MVDLILFRRSVFQGNSIDQSSLKLSTTTPVLSVIYSDVIDEELDDSDEPENVRFF
jgi:hypothetical protein